MRGTKLVALLSALLLVLAACGGGDDGGSDTTAGDGSTEETTGGGGEGGLIGVAMPTQTSERWIADGNSVKEGLEELGYEVDLQFGNDDMPT